MKTSIQKLVLLVLVFITTQNSIAQLSGLYKVGSGETFATLEDAVDSLNLVGADGLLELEIQAGSYFDYSHITPLFNYSPGDSVAIKAKEGVEVKFFHSNSSASNYVILMNGASHMSISGLSFIGTDVNYCNMIKITGGASFNTVQNNYFEAPTGGTLDGSVLIFDEESGKKEEHNTYAYNELVGGSIGIKIKGNSAQHQGPSTVVGNSITGTDYDFALKFEYVNGGEVLENDVEGGVYLMVDSTFQVWNNHFKSSTGYCLRIISHDYTVPKGPLLIANNVMRGLGLTFAFHMMASNDVKVYHNTIWNNTSVPEAFHSSDISQVEIVNNVIMNEGLYSIFDFDRLGLAVVIDYNNYYSGNGNYGSIDGIEYTSLSSWQTTYPTYDQNSTFTLPDFVAADDFRLKCTSGTALQSSLVLPEVPDDKTGTVRISPQVWKGAYNMVASKFVTVDGFVTNGTDTLKNGKVKVFGDQTDHRMLDVLAEVDIDATGYYEFPDIPFLREYWIKIVPDGLEEGYLKSYHDGSLRWDAASAISLLDSCVGESINIFPRKMVDMESGTNSISGYVNDISGTSKVLGTDPIPGLDVVLDKIPPSKTVAHTTTDENGYYTFGDLPDGNYVVTIEYEGLHADTLYDINVSGGTNRDYLDYCVDTLDRIQGCASGVGFEEQLVEGTDVYPNPFSNQFMINSDLSNYDITLFNLEGKIVLNQKNLSGNVSIQTNELLPGVYLLDIISNGVSKKSTIIKR